MKQRVLYISGSLGLGHITRDLAIANELRKQNKNIEISWLAAHPASLLIEDVGEHLLPESDLYSNDNLPAEKAAEGTRLNLLKYLNNASKEWRNNVKLFHQITSNNPYDVVIGDETYEIIVGIQKNPKIKSSPFVMIYDFVGLDAMTNNLVEWIGTYLWNRIWSKDYRKGNNPAYDLGLFVGEENDVPNKSFGFMLPNRRAWAKARLKFVGYVFPFNPDEYKDQAKVREKLNYGEEPLIICAIGGTSIGKQLLNLCGQAYTHLKESIPDLSMILVCGPRLASETLDVPNGVEVRQYVPALYEHFAASDLAIVQGGATSTLELTALRKPFIFFPVEGHFEQAQVAERLEMLGAGKKMVYSETTPKSLAEKAISIMGQDVSFKPIQTNGAKKAAQLINELLKR